MSAAVLVDIERRFVRSARIDTDIGKAEAVDGFVLQSSVRGAFDAVARAAGAGKGSAFTWTGPYGGGKSSAAIVFAAAIGPDGPARKSAACVLGKELADGLSEAFCREGLGREIIALTGRRAVFANDLAAALGGAATNDLVSAVKARAADPGSDGVLLLVDELGAYLEHAAIEGSDLHILQDLAEYAARSDGRLLLIGILHQSFERYAARLPRSVRDEWAKIQGRFQDIGFGNSVDETVELIAHAFNAKEASPRALAIAQAVASDVAERRATSPDVLAQALARCSPLHPVVAMLLGPLSRQRFGQNERSVFGFLGSVEPFGFQEFLKHADKGDSYLPDRLFDYLEANLGSAILASDEGHRFATSLEAIDRATARGGPLHVKLAKCATLIELFGAGTGLVAKRETLSLCVPNEDGAAVGQALDQLVEWSVFVHRRHLGSYAVFAGSDFDLDAALAAERGGVERFDYAAELSLPPVVAKRHYHRTGCLRWCDILVYPLPSVGCEYGRSKDARARFEAAQIAAYEEWRGARRGASSIMLIVRSGDQTDAEVEAAASALARTVDAGSIVVGVPRSSYLLRELAMDQHALRRIVASNPKLEGDAIARREVRARIADVGIRLEQEIKRGFETAIWFAAGERSAEFEGMPLSAIASAEADRVFSRAPLIVNELVNREKPSSNAMAAVRALLHAMVAHAHEERLGFQGFPPEYAFYTSILVESGLHQQDADGNWAFGPPDGTKVGASFASVWELAARLQDGEAISNLYARWAEAPIGLRAGPMPILALAWLLANQGSVAIYLDGHFTPEIDDVVADRLLQSPDALTVRHVRLGVEEDALIDGIARSVLGLTIKSPTPLDVARGLVQRVLSLPKWTQRTRDLPTETRRVRDLLIHADDPNRLLFDELSRVGSDPRACVKTIATGIAELEGAYGAMLEGLARTLGGSIGCDGDSFAGLCGRAANATGVMGDLRLDAFAQRVAMLDNSDDRIGALEALGSFLVHRPAADWTDPDVDRAHAELVRFARAFREAEAVAVARGRTPGAEMLSLVRTGINREPVVLRVDVNAAEAKAAAELAELLLGSVATSDRRVAIAALAVAVGRMEERADGAELAA